LTLPHSASQPSANWSVITRDDGSKQWAYKGKPFCSWVNDQKPGDTTGNRVNNSTWYVAQP
jgi:predicted lipoprotein with Yx(FWY)xxD motif